MQGCNKYDKKLNGKMLFICGAFVEIPSYTESTDIPPVQIYGTPIRRSSRGLRLYDRSFRKR